MSRYARDPLDSLPNKAEAENLIRLHHESRNNEALLFALHVAHQTLGRVALRTANISGAKKELLASTAGPQKSALKHLGGHFQLANELLKKHEKFAVLEHLERMDAALGTKDLKAKIADWKI